MQKLTKLFLGIVALCVCVALCVGVYLFVVILTPREPVATGTCGDFFEKLGQRKPTRMQLAQAADNCTMLFQDPSMKSPLGNHNMQLAEAASVCVALEASGCLTWDRRTGHKAASTDKWHVSSQIVWKDD